MVWLFKTTYWLRLSQTVESEQDCESLQQDLETMYTWAEDVGMEFNAGKFELLRFWPTREDAPDILYMAPDGSPIEEKESLRDLGVRVSTDLSFSEQITLAVQSDPGTAWLAGL